jgi:hypothetical protein
MSKTPAPIKQKEISKKDALAQKLRDNLKRRKEQQRIKQGEKK